jgi:hypothetical protein
MPIVVGLWHPMQALLSLDNSFGRLLVVNPCALNGIRNDKKNTVAKTAADLLFNIFPPPVCMKFDEAYIKYNTELYQNILHVLLKYVKFSKFQIGTFKRIC